MLIACSKKKYGRRPVFPLKTLFTFRIRPSCPIWTPVWDPVSVAESQTLSVQGISCCSPQLLHGPLPVAFGGATCPFLTHLQGAAVTLSYIWPQATSWPASTEDGLCHHRQPEPKWDKFLPLLKQEGFFPRNLEGFHGLTTFLFRPSASEH